MVNVMHCLGVMFCLEESAVVSNRSWPFGGGEPSILEVCFSVELSSAQLRVGR
jgi:hypothetical protein